MGINDNSIQWRKWAYYFLIIHSFKNFDHVAGSRQNPDLDLQSTINNEKKSISDHDHKEEDRKLTLTKRSGIISDPLFPQQWHLVNMYPYFLTSFICIAFQLVIAMAIANTYSQFMIMGLVIKI